MAQQNTQKQLAVFIKDPKAVQVVIPLPTNNPKDAVRWIEDQRMKWPNTRYELGWMIPFEQWGR